MSIVLHRMRPTDGEDKDWRGSVFTGMMAENMGIAYRDLSTFGDDTALTIDAYHLNGGRNVQWGMMVSKGQRGQRSSFRTVHARGGDVILVNGRHERAHPEPINVTQSSLAAPWVRWRWHGEEQGAYKLLGTGA